MTTYTAKTVITLAAGSVVSLTEKQAADRAPRLERLAAGRYRLKDALQMKRGESFGYEGELPKAAAVLVDTNPLPTLPLNKGEGQGGGQKADAKPAAKEPEKKADAKPKAKK